MQVGDSFVFHGWLRHRWLVKAAVSALALCELLHLDACRLKLAVLTACGTLPLNSQVLPRLAA